MGLLAQRHHLGEMLMIDMRIDAEQPLQYGFSGGKKVLWKWYTNF